MVEHLKCEISETKANSLVEAAEAFVDKISKDTAVSRASKALQAEMNRMATRRSQTEMDASEVFVPSEDSIRDIVRNEHRVSMGTTNPPEGNRQRKVSLVGSKSGGKRNGKSRKSRPGQQQRQRSRPSSAKPPTQSQSSSKHARGKGSPAT